MKHSVPLHFEDQQTKTLQDDQLAHAQPMDINQCLTSKLVIKYSVKRNTIYLDIICARSINELDICHL